MPPLALSKHIEVKRLANDKHCCLLCPQSVTKKKKFETLTTGLLNLIILYSHLLGEPRILSWLSEPV